MDIKFKYLDRQWDFLDRNTNIEEAVVTFLREGNYTSIETIESFENVFSQHAGVKYSVGVNSGTAALEVAYRCLGLSKNTLVVVQDNTFMATATAAIQCGFKVASYPIKEDFTPNYFTLDHLLDKYHNHYDNIVVVATHMYGIPLDMDVVCQLCSKYNAILVEDCAQAHFAEYRGTPVGNFGRVSTFSSYPTKNLGACGEAGVVVTNDPVVYKRAKYFQGFGGPRMYEFYFPSVNYRIDALQALILEYKLPFVDMFNAETRNIFNRYTQEIKSKEQRTLEGYTKPSVPVGASIAPHLYPLDAGYRGVEDLTKFMNEKGIAVGNQYPRKISSYKFIDHVYHERNRFSDKTNNNITLPIDPFLYSDEVDYIIEALNEQ